MDQAHASTMQQPTAGSQDALFDSLANYPFDTDSEFFSGLSSILGHPDIPPTPRELEDHATTVLQAKCFYFTRKHNLPPIDPADYSAWLEAHPQAGVANGLSEPTLTPAEAAQNNAMELAEARMTGNPTPKPREVDITEDAPPMPTAATSTSAEQQPPYPSSFSEIVDLITQNKPIPGIEEVPDTVLELGSSKTDKTPRRKKPWEADDETEAEDTQAVTESAEVGETEEAKINGVMASKEGSVAKILQPNAIAPSGLVSND